MKLCKHVGDYWIGDSRKRQVGSLGIFHLTGRREMSEGRNRRDIRAVTMPPIRAWVGKKFKSRGNVALSLTRDRKKRMSRLIPELNIIMNF